LRETKRGTVKYTLMSKIKKKKTQGSKREILRIAGTKKRGVTGRNREAEIRTKYQNEKKMAKSYLRLGIPNKGHLLL